MVVCNLNVRFDTQLGTQYNFKASSQLGVNSTVNSISSLIEAGFAAAFFATIVPVKSQKCI